MYVLVLFYPSLSSFGIICFGVSMLWCFHALVLWCFHALVMYLSWIYDQLVFMPCGLTLLTSLSLFFCVRVCVYICMSTNPFLFMINKLHSLLYYLL
ncbi:hypothetical protein EDC96DRAFT_201762 [Choanephora cucurbitarum]|nr:hypothetical protein EDC96DRAFT_201762 [Choanephora cucurbitarum]